MKIKWNKNDDVFFRKALKQWQQGFGAT